MPQLLPAVRDTFERSTPQQRIMSVVALLFIAAGIFAFVQFGKESAYVALFPSPLDQQQLTEVVDRLTQDQVPFEATADNVTVAAAKKGDIRLRLLTEGVPHAHVMTRADALKAAGPLTPSAELEEAQKTGLEGDIANNLRSITGIRDAHVIIAAAKQGTFVLEDGDHDASAMVQLTLEPGVTLPPQAINSLRQEVASAVPGLVPEHVTINDQSMSLLADGGSGAGNSDKSLETKVNATLDKIFGAGNAFATVNVEMQGSATTSHEIKHVPLQDKPIATDADREHYVGKNKSYDKVHENSDRGSDTIETNTQIAAGSIRRKTVAVFVSDRVASPAALAQLPSTIGAVAGIDTSRGDVIKVQGIRMAGAPGPAAAPAPSATGPSVPQPMLAGMPWPIFLLVALSVAAISSMGWIYRPQGEHKEQLATRATTQLAAGEFEPVRLHAELRHEPPHAVAAILAALPAPTTTAVLELYGADERREIVKRLTKQIAPIVRDVSDSSGRG